MRIESTGLVLGATVKSINLAKELTPEAFTDIIQALGVHGVLRFPGQTLDARALRDFRLILEDYRPEYPNTMSPTFLRSAFCQTSYATGGLSVLLMPVRTGIPTCPTTRRWASLTYFSPFRCPEETGKHWVRRALPICTGRGVGR